MPEKLDLRGLLCPQPVISTKKMLDKAGVEIVEALVDDEICVANLQRLARSLKASCNVAERDGFFAVTISKSNGSHTKSEHLHSAAPSSDTQKRVPDANRGKLLPDNKQIGSVVFISKEQFGDGDPEFSKTLANVFLQTLFESGHKPRAILLANTGVKLMARSAATRKVLDDFEAIGCDVFACGLCVEFYGLKDDVEKEQITNMFAICEYLNAAEKIIQF